MALSFVVAMSLLPRIPQFALLTALAVFTLTLFIAITSGTGISQPINLVLVILLAATVFMMFLAQNPNNENAAMMLWFGAGVWGAAAYLNYQMLGVLHLVPALLSAIGAFWIERESRMYSFLGPALFIGTALSLVIVANLLTG
jgi:hypothetical protein